MRWGTGAATTTKDILGKETERDDKEDDQREHDSDHHHSGHKGSTPRSSHPYPYRESHTAPGLHPADHEIERQEERKTSSSIGQHVESGPDDLVSSFGAVPKRPCPQQDAYLSLDAHASAPRTPEPKRLAAARNVAARLSASDLTAESPLPVMP
jgi:hypothetical protein